MLIVKINYGNLGLCFIWFYLDPGEGKLVHWNGLIVVQTSACRLKKVKSSLLYILKNVCLMCDETA